MSPLLVRQIHFSNPMYFMLKRSFRLLIVLFVLQGCTQKRNPSQVNVDEGSRGGAKEQTGCFLLLQGRQKKDSTYLRLRIQGNKVMGEMVDVPYEKDRRAGMISGRMKDHRIKGVWTFMQEGIVDSLPVEFKVHGNEVLQKAYAVEKASGRQILDSTTTFSLRYHSVACRALPVRLPVPIEEKGLRP